MTDNHTRPVLTWRPPSSVRDFLKKESERRGMRVSELLTLLVEKERETISQENKARRYRASNAMAGELGELERSAC